MTSTPISKTPVSSALSKDLIKSLPISISNPQYPQYQAHLFLRCLQMVQKQPIKGKVDTKAGKDVKKN